MREGRRGQQKWTIELYFFIASLFHSSFVISYCQLFRTLYDCTLEVLEVDRASANTTSQNTFTKSRHFKTQRIDVTGFSWVKDTSTPPG